jgi:hypothetical protein
MSELRSMIPQISKYRRIPGCFLTTSVLSQLVDRALRRAMFGHPGLPAILPSSGGALDPPTRAAQLRRAAAVVLTSTAIIVLYD